MAVSNNLVLSFCSLRPEGLSSEVCDQRESEYLRCLTQLRRVLPKNTESVRWTWVVVENTLKAAPHSEELFSFLTTCPDHLLLVGRNTGTLNKGLGELDMLAEASAAFNSFEGFDRVFYSTGRKYLTSPYVFERQWEPGAEAVVSDCLLLEIVTGKEFPTCECQYNDTLFAATGARMAEYAKWSRDRAEHMLLNSIGSERNLWSFLHDNKVPHETLGYLGVLRHDWGVNLTSLEDIKTLQLC